MTIAMAGWTDAHTHLDSGELFLQRDRVLERAVQAGVTQLLLVNSEADRVSFDNTLNCLRMEAPVRRFASLGVHPHHANSYDANLEAILLDSLSHEGIVGFGEIGLDYYYNFSPQDVQRTVLIRQLELARDRNLPVVIHCRDAYGVLAEVTRSIDTHWRGMIHCFTGTPAEMESLLALGFHVSFSGIVTFPRAKELRESAKRAPLDRILVETDAPYLAPVPHRGKTNEPAFVADTGRFLADLREMSSEEFADRTSSNFDALFLVDTVPPGY